MDDQYYEETRSLYSKISGKLWWVVVLGVALMILGQIFGSELLIVLGIAPLLLGFLWFKILAPTEPTNPISRQHLAGSTVTTLDQPESLDPLLPIGNARMPFNVESQHLLIEGATGAGKTQALKQMIHFIRDRGDTLVVVDSQSDLFKTFGRQGDIVLSPFEASSPGWTPDNEVRAPADWSAIAQSFIGNGKGEAAQWHGMAKSMFSGVARGYHQMVKDAGEPFDLKELFHLLTAAPAKEIEPFIRGTSAAALAGNDKGLSNVRMTFFETLKSWELLKQGNFSLRNWVEGEDRPSMFITYNKRQLADTKQLISCWLDQIITTACDNGTSNKPVWIIIDELSGLGEIPALITAVTELRKTGFRVIGGIQNYEQVEAIYGRNGATTITNNLSSKLILRANDPSSAERQSKMIGDARNRVTTVSSGQSTSAHMWDNDSKVSYNQSTSDQVERVVLASEISSLPDLVGYVKFSGDPHIRLTDIPIYGDIK